MARCEKYKDCANSIENGCGTLGVWEQCFIPKEPPDVGKSGSEAGYRVTSAEIMEITLALIVAHQKIGRGGCDCNNCILAHKIRDRITK